MNLYIDFLNSIVNKPINKPHSIYDNYICHQNC